MRFTGLDPNQSFWMSAQEISKGDSHMPAKLITIMIVEDNSVNMMLLRSVIEIILPQARIVEAEDGQVAVEKFKTGNLDLIFMDIRMPNKNGYEATEEIRRLETDTHIPIIALTAGTTSGERERCLEAGMDDYIAKPIVQNAILIAIKKWLPLALPPSDLSIKPGEIISHFDKAELSNQLSNKEEMIRKLLDTSKISLDRCLAELHRYNGTGDLQALTDIAHKIKGIALSSCFNRLAELAAVLEEAMEPGPREAEIMIREIDSEIQLLKELTS